MSLVLPTRLGRRRRSGEHRRGDTDRSARIEDVTIGALPAGFCGVAWSASRAVIAAEAVAGVTPMLLATATDARSGITRGPLADIADEFGRLCRSGVDLVAATTLTTGPLWPLSEAGPLEATALEIHLDGYVRALTVDGPPPLVLTASGELESMTATPTPVAVAGSGAVEVEPDAAEFHRQLAPGESVLVLSGRARSLLDEREIMRLNRSPGGDVYSTAASAGELVGSLWSLATARASKASARELLVAVISRDPSSSVAQSVAASERTASGASTTLAPSIPGFTVSHSSS